MTTYHLEVYTSAPELLDSAGSNLGVIARTEGYPSELSRELSNYRYYSFLDELPMDDPGLHPPRVVIGPAGVTDYYTITHSAFLGSDFTGRTTPTVHHAVVRTSALNNSRGEVADFLLSLHRSQDRFRFSVPTRIESLPTIDRRRGDGAFVYHSLLFRDFEQRDTLICFIADALIRFGVSGRPVVLVLEPQQALDPLLILADIFSVLPRSVQRCTSGSSHNLSAADFIRGSAFGITYPDTEFHRQIQQRHDPKRPIIVDPRNSSSFSVIGDGSFIALLRKALDGGSSQLAALLDAYEANGTSAEVLAGFCRFWEMKAALTSINSAEELSTVNTMFARLTGRTQYVDDVLNAASLEFVDSAVARPDKIALLSEIIKSEHWPKSVRVAAVNAVKSNLGEALRLILSDSGISEPNTATIAFLGEQLGGGDGAKHWQAVAKHFYSVGNVKGISLSRTILCKSQIPLKLLLKWRGQLGGMQSQAVNRLVGDLNEQMRVVLDSDGAAQAIDECAQDPKFQEQLPSVMQVATLLQPVKVRSIAIQLIGLAIKSDLESQVKELVRSVGRLGEKIIDAKNSQDIIRLATGTRFEQLVQDAFEREITLQAPAVAPPRSEPRRVLEPEPVETFSSPVHSEPGGHSSISQSRPEELHA